MATRIGHTDPEGTPIWGQGASKAWEWIGLESLCIPFVRAHTSKALSFKLGEVATPLTILMEDGTRIHFLPHPVHSLHFGRTSLGGRGSGFQRPLGFGSELHHNWWLRVVGIIGEGRFDGYLSPGYGAERHSLLVWGGV